MRHASRKIGIGLFCVGMTALVVVFALAAFAFARVPAQIADRELVAEQGVGGILAAAVVKAVFLLVMTYAASLVASKGVDLLYVNRDEGKR